jgi:hypothetical protein
MVKNSRRKQKRNRRKTYKKKMVGGEFNSSDVNELLSLGFTNEDIEFLSTVSPNINLIRQSLQQINPETGSLFTPEEIMQSVHQAFNDNDNDNDISQISNDEEDIHNDDFMYDYPDSNNTSQESLSGLNLDNSSFNDSSFMDSLHNSDLNTSNISSTNTSVSDTSMGGKKRRKTNKRRSKSNSRKSPKSRRRIIKGGNCYGRGVGTNSYDPNYSIYNTNLPTLFPYKPIK